MWPCLTVWVCRDRRTTSWWCVMLTERPGDDAPTEHKQQTSEERDETGTEEGVPVSISEASIDDWRADDVITIIISIISSSSSSSRWVHVISQHNHHHHLADVALDMLSLSHLSSVCLMTLPSHSNSFTGNYWTLWCSRDRHTSSSTRRHWDAVKFIAVISSSNSTDRSTACTVTVYNVHTLCFTWLTAVTIDLHYSATSTTMSAPRRLARQLRRPSVTRHWRRPCTAELAEPRWMLRGLL